MRSMLFAVLTLLAFPGAAQTFPNEPKGFRDLEWDADLAPVAAEFSKLTAPDKEGMQIGERLADRLTLGNATLESIAYRFYRGRLHTVLLMGSRGASEQRHMQDAFEAQFGPGTQPNRYLKSWHWRGTTTFVLLDCQREADRCVGAMTSQAVSARRRADEKSAAAAKAKGDF
jgi:hypothetical protein